MATLQELTTNIQQKICQLIASHQHHHPLDKSIEDIVEDFYEHLKQLSDADMTTGLRLLTTKINYVDALQDSLINYCYSHKASLILIEQLHDFGADDSFAERLAAYHQIGHFLNIQGTITMPLLTTTGHESMSIDLSCCRQDKTATWIAEILTYFYQHAQKYCLTAQDVKFYQLIEQAFTTTASYYFESPQPEERLLKQCLTQNIVFLPCAIEEQGRNHPCAALYYDGLLIWCPYTPHARSYETHIYKVAPRFLQNHHLNEEGLALLAGLLKGTLRSVEDSLLELMLTQGQLTNSSRQEKLKALAHNRLMKFPAPQHVYYDVTIDTALSVVQGLMYLLAIDKQEGSSATLQAKYTYQMHVLRSAMADLAVDKLVEFIHRQPVLNEEYTTRLEFIKLFAMQHHGQESKTEYFDEASKEIKRLAQVISLFNKSQQQQILSVLPENIVPQVILGLENNLIIHRTKHYQPRYTILEFTVYHQNVLTTTDLLSGWYKCDIERFACKLKNKALDAVILMSNEPDGLVFSPLTPNENEVAFAIAKAKNYGQGQITLESQEEYENILQSFPEYHLAHVQQK